MYEFEKHEKLTEFIQEMAHTGKAPREWTTFIETLNQSLRINNNTRDAEMLNAVEDLKDFAFMSCPLHRADELESIIDRISLNLT
jgi:hypothetical protein